MEEIDRLIKEAKDRYPVGSLVESIMGGNNLIKGTAFISWTRGTWTADELAIVETESCGILYSKKKGWAKVIKYPDQYKTNQIINEYRIY